MPTRTIWISYDLGVKGDYSSLYAWMDNRGAQECGEGVAFLKLEAASAQQMLAQIKADLEQSVSLSKTDRIYAICKNDDGALRGRFLFGKRKAAPWQGYGNQATEEDV